MPARTLKSQKPPPGSRLPLRPPQRLPPSAASLSVHTDIFHLQSPRIPSNLPRLFCHTALPRLLNHARPSRMKLSFLSFSTICSPPSETVIMTSTLPTPSICIRIFSSFFSRYWTYSCSPSSDVWLPDAVPPLSPDAVLPLPPDVSFSPVPVLYAFSAVPSPLSTGSAITSNNIPASASGSQSLFFQLRQFFVL